MYFSLFPQCKHAASKSFWSLAPSLRFPEKMFAFRDVCVCWVERERERESQPFSSQVTTANEKETVLICTSKSKNRFCQSKVSPFEHEKKLLLLFENVSIY